MKNDIQQAINNCTACREGMKSKTRQALVSKPPSEALEPMREVGLDLFDAAGHKWLVMTDRYLSLIHI